MILVVVAAVVAVAAFALGRVAGGRLAWRAMLTDRRVGHLALEQLGKAHGAKIELVELP